MVENHAIQANKPITAVSNNDKMSSFVSKKELAEVQLQYDKVEENMSDEELKKAVNKINEYILGINTRFQYKIHEGTERIIVKLVDTESNAVIKEIPPEKMLDVLASIWDSAGILVDRKE